MVRLARDRAGKELLPTPNEVAKREAEAAKLATEARSRAEAAEQKNAELAAEVAALRALLQQNQRDKT